jgi:hypothetical protein
MSGPYVGGGGRRLGVLDTLAPYVGVGARRSHGTLYLHHGAFCAESLRPHRCRLLAGEVFKVFLPPR